MAEETLTDMIDFMSAALHDIEVDIGSMSQEEVYADGKTKRAIMKSLVDINRFAVHLMDWFSLDERLDAFDQTAHGGEEIM